MIDISIAVWNKASLLNCLEDLKVFYEKHYNHKSNTKSSFALTKKKHKEAYLELKDLLYKHDKIISSYGNNGIVFFIEYDLKKYEKGLFLLDCSKKELDNLLWNVLNATVSELNFTLHLIANNAVKTI